MTESMKKELFSRNQLIINKILEKIESTCPGSVDLIGIAGSFCNGTFYEKSDLDLVIIINNEAANVINNCFICDGIGHDIYTYTWDKFEKMAKYEDAFVTKLFDLDIVYKKDAHIMEKYLKYQKELIKNMNDDNSIKEKIGVYLGDAIQKSNELNKVNDKCEFFVTFGSILNDLENIMYLINKQYIVLGTKGIPEEIKRMKKIPDGFIENYEIIYNLNDPEQIKIVLQKLILIVSNYFKENNIKIVIKDNYKEKENKKRLSAEVLRGTYEELYSNYYNKLYYAARTGNSYLSFRTMLDAQGFFDEFYNAYNMPKVFLIEKYNPDKLVYNAENFKRCLNGWKDLYDRYGLEIEEYDSIDELYEERTNKIDI